MEKFVTDLDKLLDDFEIEDLKHASEDIYQEIYDSSGYISLKTSSALSCKDSDDRRRTPIPLEDYLKDTHELSTPSKLNSPLIEHPNNKSTLTSNGFGSICLQNDSNTDKTFAEGSGYHPVQELDKLEPCLNKSYEQSDGETYFSSDDLDLTKHATSEILDPPTKKCRPNSLLGLSSQTLNIQSGMDNQNVIHDDEQNEVFVSYQATEEDQQLNNSYESIDENVKVEECPSDLIIDDTFCNSNLKESEHCIPITKNKCIKESEIWQGISIDELGFKEPLWITDDTSDNCMECQMSFTMFRRRHHCRACGRLLCNKCCCWRTQLRFSNKLFPKERVCAICFQYLIKAEASRKQWQNNSSSNNIINSTQISSSLVFNRCGIDQNLSDTMSNSTETSITSKSVTFADGIRPGGDLSEFNKRRIITPTKFQSDSHSNRVDIISPKLSSREPSLINNHEFLIPDIFQNVESKTNYQLFTITKNFNVLLKIINLPYCTCSDKNRIDVNFEYTQSCNCDNIECWLFVSDGLETIGTEEVVFILKKLPQEDNPPIEIFQYYFQIYQRAFRNEEKCDNMEMSVERFQKSDQIFKDWVGILHIRPSFQYLENIPHLPPTFLVGILIHRLELLWALLLPLRLILALGYQSRFYPCSLISDRNRGPVFNEVGPSIIHLVNPTLSLCEVPEENSFSPEMMPTVPGMWIHLLPSQETIVQIPKLSYNNILSILSTWQLKRTVLALVSTFNREADSHLVCLQNMDTGKYSSRVISIQNTERLVTGATMILLVSCKNNEDHGITIVEDVIVLRLSSKQLEDVTNSLKTMTDLALQCGLPKENIIMQDSKSVSLTSKSIIKIVWTDSRQMCDMASVKRPSLVTDETIQTALGYLPYDDNKIIKSHRIPSSLQNLMLQSENQSYTNHKLVWSRFHMVETESAINQSSYEEPINFENIIRDIAYNFANSIIPFLDMLYEIKLVNIGLRIKIQPDTIDWLVGCSKKYQHSLVSEQSLLSDIGAQKNSIQFNNIEQLPEVCKDYVKEVLVPFLYSQTQFVRKGSLISELEFHIIC